MNDGDVAGRLEHYLTKWGLAEPTLLAETFTGKVYTVVAEGEQVILKLLTPDGQQDASSGAAALRWWDGKGAVRLLRADKEAHLLEYAAGDDLVGLVVRGEDDEATQIIVGVLNQLHMASTMPLPDGLIPLKVWFRDLFKQAEMDSGDGLNSTYVRAASLAETLLANPRDVRVLHGDIHHGNIRYHPRRGWLAFDPNGLLGERTFDAANTLCNPMDMPELVENEGRLRRQAGILADGLGIDVRRVLAYLVAYAGLSASWFLSDGQDPGPTLRIAELAESQLKNI